MASIEGGSDRPTGGSRLSFFRAMGKDPNSWLRRNWQTAVILVLVVLLAFFVRSYFVLGPSVDNGFLVSGGSDSYYHMRVIDYVTETGQHLYMDPMLNYPWDMRNPRPPLFDWSVAVTGMMWSTITGEAVADGTGMTLVSATAFWGALTVIPVYMIGRQAFNRKAGLVAAFLFALTPGHIERSVASQADHDAMILFLVVFAFYFLLMSLKTIVGDKWVKKWDQPRSILPGLKEYLRVNPVSMIYAALGGVCVAAVAFIWTGYMYILIIVLVYFLFQVLVNRFKNVDSLGVMMSVGIMLGLAFILAAPLYYVMDYWGTWFDVPVLLFLAMMVVGLIFVTTRDLPWTLVIPAFIILVIVALAAISVVAPTLFDAIITGQGYLVKSKLYSTISEAQAPNFSTLAMSFGIVTFWLALVGIGYAAVKIPKNLSAYFVFLVVWTATAVFMAASAGRFLFNAAPAFAIMAGWILVLVIDMIKFQDYPKALSGLRPWRSPFAWLKSVFRVKYVMGAFFVFMLILLPNAWAAVDAGIPSEFKEQYDLQVYNAMPYFLRPEGYDSINGSVWYFGAFGFSLPLPWQYWPAAWSWYRTQNTELPVTERPAFLSWWDYGFEAIQAGQHPTVADNFQNGYQFAGNYITCADEAQAVAMLVTRCIEYEDLSDGTPLAAALAAHGVDVAQVRDILTNPSKYVQVVLSHPDVYGNFSPDLSPANAKFVAARVEIALIGEEECAALYNEVRAITGSDVGYFAIDSRLFPFSATGFNIFYAPAKLSDHIIDEASNSPVDFYQIYAVVINEFGQQETVPVGEVTSGMTVIDYTIVYTELFYQTMLYRAFMGYGPYDIGYTEQGIPGISGSLANLPPMQGWNQSHFRMVYRTAYFNPFPADQVANHSDAWRAISYSEALVLKEKIANGEAIGVVDTSAFGLTQGVVFVQYYDGAIVQGQVTTGSGLPYPDVWVTVLDEYGIPHDYVRTDGEGRFSVIAPFGEVEVVYSIGNLDKRLLTATELGRKSFDISYDQAMRRTSDYVLDGDMTVTSANLKGRVYWDLDGDGKYTTGTDQPISGATVVAENEANGFRAEAVSTSTGYTISGIPAMQAQVYAVVEGHPTTPQEVQVLPLADTTVDIAIVPASITGTVSLEDGSAASGFLVKLTDQVNGTTTTRATDASGKFSFTDLVYGEYEISSGVAGASIGTRQYKLTDGEDVSASYLIKQAMVLSGQAWLSIGQVAANATISFFDDDSQVVVRADSGGHFSVILPAGSYDLYIAASTGGRDFAALAKVMGEGGSITLNPTLVPASYLTGKVQGASSADGLSIRFESRSSGASLTAVTNETGHFRALVPNDLYFVQTGEQGAAYWGDVTVTASVPLILDLASSAKVSGLVWYDADGDSVKDTGEGLEGIPIMFRDIDGRAITQLTGIGGSYEFQLVPGKSYAMSIEEPGYFPYSKAYAPLTASVQDNVELIAMNRTLTGTAYYLGATAPGITVSFTATGGGAWSMTTQTGAGGSFAVQLKPGTYQVQVDQDVVPGNNVSRYQFSQELKVQVGQDPEGMDIALTKRYLVTGSITPDRSAQATLTVTGPDRRELTVGTSFSLYLQEGDYGFYVYILRLGQRYATLIEHTVAAGGSSIVLVNEAAFLVQGSVKEGTKLLTGNVPVTIAKSTGGELPLTSGLAGGFSTYLPAGSYTASVDYRTVETAQEVDRYVRYQGSLGFEVNSIEFISVATEKGLDNSTLAGVVRVGGQAVPATLEFVPASTTSIWANATASPSGYAVELAPGNYSVYVKEVSGPAVLMGKLEVEPYALNHMDFDLVPGVRYFGVTQRSGVAGEATLEFSSANYKMVQSGSDGSFEVYLPPGTYTVLATAQGSERGVRVDYGLEYSLVLQSSQGSVVDLVKEPQYGVDLQWDVAEKGTIEAGQSVSYNLRLVNTGNVPDTYTLSAVGLLSGWTATFSQSSLAVDFGSENTQLITLTISTPDSAEVDHPVITIRAQSAASSQADTVAVDVGILPNYGVALAYDSASSTSGTEYVYKLTYENTGNAADVYDISMSNLEQLATWGWKAEIRLSGGTWSETVVASLGAGNQGNLELRLTPVRDNPYANPTVVMLASSQKSAETSDVLEFEPGMPRFSVPSGGLSVTGDGVSTSSPEIPTGTMIILALVVAMATILMVLSIQKGVFRRKKR